MTQDHTANAPLELAIKNQTDRFSLAIDVIDRSPKLHGIGSHAKERFRDLQTDCRNYAYEHGIVRPGRGTPRPDPCG